MADSLLSSIHTATNQLTGYYNTYVNPVFSQVPYAEEIIKTTLFASLPSLSSMASFCYTICQPNLTSESLAASVIENTVRGVVLPITAYVSANLISHNTGINADLLNIPSQIGFQALYTKAKNTYHSYSMLDLKNNIGNTALMQAAENNGIDTLNALIQAGANLDCQNYYGNTALMIATIYDNRHITNALIQAGANLELQNHDGNTALMTAAINNRPGSAKALILAGANTTLINKNGNTALTWATERKNDEIAFLILDTMSFQQIKTELENNPSLKDVINRFREKENKDAIAGAVLDKNAFVNFPAMMSLKWLAAKAVAKQYSNQDLVTGNIPEDVIGKIEASRKYVPNLRKIGIHN